MAEKEETYGIVFDWDPQVVSLFVEQVNMKPEGRPAFPEWLSNIFSQSGLTNKILLMKGIANFLLKEVASSEKLFGCTFIGPLTLVQYGQICGRTAVIESDCSMQHIMKAILLQNTTNRPMYLVSLAVMHSREADAGAKSLNFARLPIENIVNLFNN